MNMLKLYRKNYCVIIGKSPSFAGMLKKISDCVTWGEIDDSTMKELAAKRGKKTRVKGKEEQKKFFRLSPPKRGYGRKGIKTPFSIGGALGYRGKKINDLIRRML
jgi:large subunit ribosomal protein L30